MGLFYKISIILFCVIIAFKLVSTCKLLKRCLLPLKSPNNPTVKLDHIVDNIYLGNWLDSINPVALTSNNIKHIITLNYENYHTPNDLKMFKELNVQYRRIHLDDTMVSSLSEAIESGIPFIENSNGNILIHCTAGISRSVSLIIAYLIKVKKMSFDEALKLVQSKRPIANPNIGFKHQLKSL